MYLGDFIEGEKIIVTATTHKFETGEEFNGTVSGFYLREGDEIGDKVDITFSLLGGLTGLYYAQIDTTELSGGAYFVVTEALIDTVTSRKVDYFTIRNKTGGYGVSRYGIGLYA